MPGMPADIEAAAREVFRKMESPFAEGHYDDVEKSDIEIIAEALLAERMRCKAADAERPTADGR